MAKLKTLLDEALRQHLPQSRWGKAIDYALSQWASLQIYVEDRRCEIDDNHQAAHRWPDGTTTKTAAAPGKTVLMKCAN